MGSAICKKRVQEEAGERSPADDAGTKVVAADAPATTSTESRMLAHIQMKHQGSGESRVQRAPMLSRILNVPVRKFNAMIDGTHMVRRVEKSPAEAEEIERVLRQCWLFESAGDAIIASVVDKMGSQTFQAGATVIGQGDRGTTFYLIASGTCEVLVDGKVLPDKSLQPGHWFGELALLYEAPRSATVRAKGGECKVWTLDKHTFRQRLRKSDEQLRSDNVAFLQEIPFFAKFGGHDDEDTASYFARISDGLHPVSFGDSEYIIRKGEPGSIFYIIKSGRCRVVLAADEAEAKVASAAAAGQGQGGGGKVLNPGSWFGEQALIGESNIRTASVIADGPVVCMGLDVDSYHELLGRHEMFRHIKQASPVARKKEGSVPLLNLKDYTTKRLLGAGGYGVVSLVERKKDGMRIVMKRMQKHLVVMEGMQSFVRSEIQLMAEFRKNKSIVTLIGISQDADSVYIAMQLLEGGEMFNLVNALGTLSEKPHCRFVAACVTNALQAVHQHGIAFRDVKLENLVMDSKGYVRLIDFGLAKRVLAKTYTLCGSMRYCAPEIISGFGHHHAVDWWAMGICLYECCYGFSVFDSSGDDVDLCKQIVSAEVKFPHLPAVSDGFTDIVTGLLKKNPAVRLGCMAHVSSCVMKHKWFDGFDWEALRACTMPCPHVPPAFNEERCGEGVYLDEQLKYIKKYRPEDDPDTDWLSIFDGEYSPSGMACPM